VQIDDASNAPPDVGARGHRTRSVGDDRATKACARPASTPMRRSRRHRARSLPPSRRLRRSGGARPEAIEAPFAAPWHPAHRCRTYVQPGTMIATLQRLDTMRVDFTVPNSSRNLRMGQPATFGLTRCISLSRSNRRIDPKIDAPTRLISVRAEVKTRRRSSPRPVRARACRGCPPTKRHRRAADAVVTSLYGDTLRRHSGGRGASTGSDTAAAIAAIGRRSGRQARRRG